MLHKRIAWAVAVLAVAWPITSPGGREAWAVHEVGHLRVLPEESRIEFVASYSFVSHHLNIGGEIEGLLNVRSGEARTNLANPTKGTFAEIVIDPRSLDTGNRWRDERLKEQYLEVEKFPEIRFRVTKLTRSRGFADLVEKSDLTLEGRLTLHGATRQIVVKGRRVNNNRRVVVDGEAVVPMSRFGMKLPKAPPFLTGRDDVKVRFHIVLKGSLGKGGHDALSQ